MRIKYIKSKNLLRKHNTEENKLTYTNLGKEYKKMLKQCKRKYIKEFNNKLLSLKKDNPKEYWKIINGDKKNKNVIPINREIFMDHFKELSNQNLEGRDEFDRSNINKTINEELNVPFTYNEIAAQIKKLKSNKAYGVDQILNEFLKCSPHVLIELLVNFFNIILDSGIVPNEWAVSLIVPLYKGKGKVTDADNYRGITILSCMGKLFTAVINCRLQTYLDSMGVIGDEQAGFRKGFSTLDNIFILSNVINIYMNNKKRIYCTFTDYRKAFDLVGRCSLWHKLLSNNINGKILNIIYNLYDQAKSTVLLHGSSSEFFKCNIGVRQGENLSPLLFAIFLNDFDRHLSSHYEGLQELSDKIRSELSDNDIEIFFKMFSLLYADDTIVLAESAKEMQRALNAVKAYCQTWYLEVNISKTKVVIFSRGKVRKYPVFKYGADNLEVVDDYIYLGTTINYNGSFKKAQNKQVKQASRALFSMREKSLKLNISIKTQVELFDRAVMPILLYGSEIWGYEDITQIEQFHHKFLKRLIGVKPSTANCIIRGEFGRFPIQKYIDSRMLKYWIKISTESESKTSNLIYRLMKKLFDSEAYRAPWLCKIKSLLDNCGLSYIWFCDMKTLNLTVVSKVLNQCLNDTYTQNWHSELDENGLCTSKFL